MTHMRRHVPVAYLLQNNPKLFFELLLGNVQVEGHHARAPRTKVPTRKSQRLHTPSWSLHRPLRRRTTKSNLITETQKSSPECHSATSPTLSLFHLKALASNSNFQNVVEIYNNAPCALQTRWSSSVEAVQAWATSCEFTGVYKRH